MGIFPESGRDCQTIGEDPLVLVTAVFFALSRFCRRLYRERHPSFLQNISSKYGRRSLWTAAPGALHTVRLPLLRGSRPIKHCAGGRWRKLIRRRGGARNWRPRAAEGRGLHQGAARPSQGDHATIV